MVFRRGGQHAGVDQEAAVALHGHHLALRAAHGKAESLGHGGADQAHAVAVIGALGLVVAVVVAGADGRADLHAVLREDLLQLLDQPVGVDGHAVAVAVFGHLLEVGGAALGHSLPGAPLEGPSAGLDEGDQLLQDLLRVAVDADLGGVDFPQLPGIDVDLNDLALFHVIGVSDLPGAGLILVEAVADGHDDVRVPCELVGKLVAPAAHAAGVVGIVAADDALAHIGRADGGVQQDGQLLHLRRGVGDHSPHAAHQHGPLRVHQQLRSALHCRTAASGPVHDGVLLQAVVPQEHFLGDLLCLHVHGDVDEHHAGAAAHGGGIGPGKRQRDLLGRDHMKDALGKAPVQDRLIVILVDVQLLLRAIAPLRGGNVAADHDHGRV